VTHRDKFSSDEALTGWDAASIQCDQMQESWQWVAPKSAYIHIPFCSHRCGYCNFAVTIGDAIKQTNYLEALGRELSWLKHPRTMQTVFVGGGTPTHLSPLDLSKLLDDVRTWLPIEPGHEWTFEANPLDVCDALCQQLIEAGVNRLSIGVQSFDDNKLKSLDRNHCAAEAIRAIECATQRFKNVSIDLMFGAPNETIETWQSDLDQAIASGVNHVSTYGLTIEKGTRFFSLDAKSLINRPTENLELAMYELAVDRLTRADFEHYEVSNFARHRRRCKHNEAYWKSKGWWAFGAGASRSLGQTRSTNHASTTQYMRMVNSGQLPIAERQVLTHKEWTADWFVFGLRTRDGVDIDYIKRIGQPEVTTRILDRLHPLIDEGWFEQTDNTIRLAHKGLVVSDLIWPKIYAEVF
jgi:oxygen-independent coproporphyrinogen III oxidase